MAFPLAYLAEKAVRASHFKMDPLSATSSSPPLSGPETHNETEYLYIEYTSTNLPTVEFCS